MCLFLNKFKILSSSFIYFFFNQSNRMFLVVNLICL